MLNLHLITVNKNLKCTEGVLVDLSNNNILCVTLEDPIRDINGNGKFDGSEVKIYGETAIPNGTYKLKIHNSPRYKKEMVMICNVSDFTGVLFHWGRTVENTEGCVLVGEYEGENKLKNIGMTDKLVKLLKDNGSEGTVKIDR